MAAGGLTDCWEIQFVSTKKRYKSKKEDITPTKKPKKMRDTFPISISLPKISSSSFSSSSRPSWIEAGLDVENEHFRHTLESILQRFQKNVAGISCKILNLANVFKAFDFVPKTPIEQKFHNSMLFLNDQKPQMYAARLEEELLVPSTQMFQKVKSFASFAKFRPDFEQLVLFDYTSFVWIEVWLPTRVLPDLEFHCSLSEIGFGFWLEASLLFEIFSDYAYLKSDYLNFVQNSGSQLLENQESREV